MYRPRNCGLFAAHRFLLVLCGLGLVGLMSLPAAWAQRGAGAPIRQPALRPGQGGNLPDHWQPGHPNSPWRPGHPSGPGRPGAPRHPAAIGVLPIDPVMPWPQTFGRSTAQHEVTPWRMPPASTLLASSPAAAAHQFHSENAFRGKSYASALRHAQHALVEEPENIHLQFYQAQILLGLDDVTGAAALFRQAHTGGGASRLTSVAAALSRLVTPTRARELLRAFPPTSVAQSAPLDVRLLQAFQYHLAGDAGGFTAIISGLLDESVDDPLLMELAAWSHPAADQGHSSQPAREELPRLELLPYEGR